MLNSHQRHHHQQNQSRHHRHRQLQGIELLVTPQELHY
jgi:hypothetical protein